MTQEEKSLLFKDLSARLPYGVKVGFIETNLYSKQIGDLLNICISTETEILWHDLDSYYNLIPKTEKYCILENIKPYLRSIHKLTEEELEELEFLTDSDYVDYCNKHHIDYRNLISKGLALEAPEGMYNEK